MKLKVAILDNDINYLDRLSSILLYIGLAFFAQHNPILSKNLVDVILYGELLHSYLP